MTTIAWYITGHGFGHAIRSVTIANEIEPSVEVIFRTSVPRSFFEREMRRRYRVEYARFDCGCLQINSVSVAIKETLDAYMALAQKNRGLLDDEVCWCRENGVDLIVSDITPFAFDVAREALLPSVAVTNFTWYDIYQEYIDEFPEFTPYLGEILSQYRRADSLLSLEPALPMPYFTTQQIMPVVGRRGTVCREKILKEYATHGRASKIALIYVGDFGMEGASWQHLSLFKEWLFLGINVLPGAPDNYCTIDFNTISYPDAVASADCVISKLGYGVVSESMLNKTPLIYLPRSRFVEYPVLEAAVVVWGGGIALTEEQFISIDWEEALTRVCSIENLQTPPEDGALKCAHILTTKACRHVS